MYRIILFFILYILSKTMPRKITRRRFLADASIATAALPFAPAILEAVQPDAALILWYDKPATEWTDALPVGNGRLGAMIFGGPANEQLQLNEDTLYAGSPYDPNNPEALKALAEARRLIFEGKYKEAHELVGAKMMANPIKQMPYEPVGDLKLSFPSHDNFTNYRRQLDLNTAIATVSYKVGPTTFKREVFVSPVDQVIVVKLTADTPRSLNFSATFETPQKATVSTDGNNVFALRGVNGDAFGIKGGLNFEALAVMVTPGGESVAENQKIVVRKADSAVILIAIATSYVNYKNTNGNPRAIARKHLVAAGRKSFEQLRSAHVREHQRLFHRVKLDLDRK